MWLAKLALVDVRSYSTMTCEFLPGVSLLIGRNGQGKTNIVEAIGYLATQTSHRVATDAPLIRLGTDKALITGEVATTDRTVLLELALLQGRPNRARVNGVPVTRFRDALGHLSAVTFSPEDLAIVKGDPGDRRKFLDDLVVQFRPRMAGVYADFDHVLKQRNALLKAGLNRSHERRMAGGDFTASLAVWDEQLVPHAAAIVLARLDIIEQLRPAALTAYSSLATGATTVDVGLNYRSSALTHATPRNSPDVAMEAMELPTDHRGWEQAITQALQHAATQERARGMTVVGPHRDDLSLTLGSHPVRGFASQGECWSLALALRLASIQVLATRGESPIVILDDVFAELDRGRRTMLLQFLTQVEQVFITAAVEEDLPPELTGHRFDVQGGRVSRRSAA